MTISPRHTGEPGRGQVTPEQEGVGIAVGEVRAEGVGGERERGRGAKIGAERGPRGGE